MACGWTSNIIRIQRQNSPLSGHVHVMIRANKTQALYIYSFFINVVKLLKNRIPSISYNVTPGTKKVKKNHSQIRIIVY